MLGKLIKNEFVQRVRPIGLVLGGELIFSLFIAILDTVITSSSPEMLRLLLKLTVVLYSLSIVAGVLGVIFLTLNDFRSRLFKDQGYLTHALPVKTSSIMMARMISDIVFVAVTILAFMFCICISTKDFSVFSSFLDVVRDICRASNLQFSNSSFVTLTILIIASILLTCLMNIWHMNAAYSIGHAFTSGKRIISIVAYIVIWLVGYMIIYLVVSIISTNAIDQMLAELFTDSLSAMIFLYAIIDVFELIALVVLSAISAMVCKKHLNLE